MIFEIIPKQQTSPQHKLIFLSYREFEKEALEAQVCSYMGIYCQEEELSTRKITSASIFGTSCIERVLAFLQRE